ncbi:FecR domain-containing protein [Deminuibacter soli]|uniref:DUF4974 domain-containing protein n=1 Tax=Deminuibacter soli TaxID=2291815 RepID=A0A3E1ND73_9BACT|nr:FecR domain-containing protein [Deminuibacter soli]RFM25718.1 DUF4974 domain-containing protein [Deminuibacter soli]
MEISTSQIRAFLENRCSAEEAEIIHRWLQQHPHALDALLDENEWLQFEDDDLLPARRSQQLFASIQQRKKARVLRLHRMRVALRVAAIVAVMVTAAGFLYGIMQRTADTTAPTLAAATATRDSVVMNYSAKQLQIRLEDSSEITLQPNSAVRYNWPFGKNDRNISLNGAAAFVVHHAEKQPFTVYTPGFSTTALGTVFQVNAFKGEHTASVKLLQGKVLVRNLVHRQQQAYLKPGEQYVFSNTSFNLTPVNANPSAPDQGAVAAHRKDVDTGLTFSNMPVPVIMQQLTAAYHVHIMCADTTLVRRKFTGHFSRNDSLEDILQTIAQLNDLTVNKKGSGYEIKPMP